MPYNKALLSEKFSAERGVRCLLGMMLKNKFVHFTKNIGSLESILRHGLLIRARRRNVWKYFVRRKEFRAREPQQFGMTCVHSYRTRPNQRCISNFGQYGVGLSESWMLSNNFRKVMYLRKNGITRLLLQPQFNTALNDLDVIMESKSAGDAFPRMSYTNRNMAAWYGAYAWCDFLELFQYMEPHKHGYQSEWRYARPEPYHTQHEVEELQRNLESGKGWSKHIHLLKFLPEDVESIYLPRSSKHRAGDFSDDRYAHKPIVYT